MALAALSGDEQCIHLQPSVQRARSRRRRGLQQRHCSELRALTQALLQQLRADHEAAAALGRLAGLRSCKELRETKKIGGRRKGL